MTSLPFSKSLWVPLALVAFVAVVLPILLKKLFSRDQTAVGYRSRKKLLTSAERSFFGALEMALDSQYRVFAKVRLADLIEPASPADRSTFQSAFNRIAAKHADFIICRKADLAIVGAVELDDQSHESAKRQARDRFLEQALQSARIPLLRIKAARQYDTAQLSSQLTALLAAKTTDTNCN